MPTVLPFSAANVVCCTSVFCDGSAKIVFVIFQLCAAFAMFTACQRIERVSGCVTVHVISFSSSTKVLAVSPTRNSMFDVASVSTVG